MHLLRSLRRNALDLLFPLTCLGCGTGDTLLCERCLANIVPAIEQTCPFCRKHRTPNGETCLSCSGSKSLDGVFVGYDYQDKIVGKALHAFKYRSLELLGDPLGKLFSRSVRSADIAIPDIILPVPLHPWRLRYRGFNQSEHLGRHLAASLLPGSMIPVDTESLVRKRFTLPQQQMRSAEARKENIRGAFSVRPSGKAALSGKYIWLIDDVATTASTLEACAKILKKTGAKKVYGIVLARG